MIESIQEFRRNVGEAKEGLGNGLVPLINEKKIPVTVHPLHR
jgi:hypothetical protein